MNTPRPLKIRLCAMMFGQYFVQGSYLGIVSVYLKDALAFTDDQVGNFLAALALGPLLAPLIFGQLVDRVMATEKVVAACHFFAGLVMLALYTQTNYGMVLALGTIYSVLYVPTMMLTNTIAFRHLSDREREFPIVRLFGTLGFIVPAWLIEFYFLRGLSGDALNAARGVAFAVSGIAGLLMAAYCLTLPPTPPSPEAKQKFAPGVVFGLLRRRDFFFLTLVTFVVAGVHNFYFVWNGPLLKTVLGRIGEEGKVQTFMTIGQIAELAAMTIVSTSVLKLGYKGTMTIGLAAYALRCVALGAAGDGAFSPETSVALAATGNALHGVCFGFFLAVAVMYVNNTAPPDAKGSMQTIYGTLIFGLGGVLGANLGGKLGDKYLLSLPDALPKVYDWNGIWLTCAAAAAVCLAVFVVAFPRTQGSDAKNAASSS